MIAGAPAIFSMKNVSLGFLLIFTVAYCLFLTDVCLTASSMHAEASNAAPTQSLRQLQQLLSMHPNPAVQPQPVTVTVTTPCPSQSQSQSLALTHPVSEGIMETHHLLPPNNVGDSGMTVHIVRGRGKQSSVHDKMVYCTFTNIHVHHDAATGNTLLLLRLSSLVKHSELSGVAKQCWSGHYRENEPNFCKPCFHPAFTFDVLPYEYSQDVSGMEKRQWQQYRVLDHTPLMDQVAPLTSGLSPLQFQHMWSIHKWVRSQHIAHWAQKLVMFQSLYQHSSLFDSEVPPLDAILFLDSNSDYSEHQSVILNASLSSALTDRHPLLAEPSPARWLWADELEQRSLAANGSLTHTPLNRLSFTPHYGIFSTHSDDTIQFRREVYALIGLPALAKCPPRKTVLLYRHNRRILNQQAIVNMLYNEFGINEVSVETINGNTPSRDQIALFAETGLMVSSHSSQLINVLFSQPGSAMVEVAAEFYNADFSEYAHGMGVFFQYALGGEIDPNDSTRKEQPLQRECIAALSACEGYSYCILKQRFKCRVNDYPNKQHAFLANLTAVRIAVKNTIGHLDWLCQGRWREPR